MSDSLNITPAQARAIVLRAAAENGWISQQDRANSRATVLQALANTRRGLGNALEIISHDLSSSKAHFALELVQNAEDAEFTRARELGQQPYIRFSVRPASIVVEFNEDGFIEKHVDAICGIGQSTKRKDRGYIGEKGIGFKSVFQVATAIHIQSNSFSFSFQYGEGENRDKLGVITPIWEGELIPLHSRPLTRMTLTPFQAEEAIPYTSLVAQFQEDIPDNLLLFLSKLQKIEILCQHPDGRSTLTTFRKTENGDGSMIHVLKSVGDADGTSVTENPPDQYHITRNQATQLSPHISRARMNSCEVVLAFPVDDASRPLISFQLCFAFLPIRMTNFTFIIQADFILPASREDIINTPRNIDILRRVAETFRDAVLQFVRDDSPLRYKWIKYLPSAQSLGGVWDILPTEITRLLCVEDILYSQESLIPCQPNNLRTLPRNTHLDSSGLPLFHDRPGPNRKYLSQRYDREDVEILRRVFELHDIEDIHMYHRIKQDLESGTSKMMGHETDDDWHSRAALLILSIFSRSAVGLKNMIRELPLIPLGNGEWVNATRQELYLPAQTGPEIPRDIIITVDTGAAANGSRKALFKELGVTDIPPQTVVDQLLTYYSRRSGTSNLASSLAHVRYLYWHHENRDDPRLLLIWLYGTNDRRVTSQRNLMYFQTADVYGPYELLKAFEHPTDPNRNIPECPVSFLKSDYTTLFPPSTRRHGSSWLKWLEKGLGVRRVPNIKANAGSLSMEFRHIITYRPDKLVGVLKKHWDDYDVDMSEPIVRTLSQSKVACSGGQLRCLKDTYLPLHELKDTAHTLGVGQEFPFLKVSDDLEANVILRDWRFLHEFEVGFEPDLNFYVEVLRQHGKRHYGTWGSEIREKISNTYKFIAEDCSDNQKAWLREEIDAQHLILSPCSFHENAAGPIWINIESCAWHGPVDLLEKEPLSEVPEYRDNQKISRLFREILDIKDATWSDYLETLSNLRRLTTLPPNLPEKALKLYQLLLNDGRSTPDWLRICERFQTERLIYIPSTSNWVSPSECLWDSPVPIDGKTLILQSYPEELKPLFLGKLRIAPASLTTLVEELFTLATQQPTAQRVKQLIWAINGMKPRPSDLTTLSTCDFLPVRVSRRGVAQQIEFLACQSDFAIVDRIKLADIFEGHVDFLDFSLEDILQLEPFLTSLDLGDKYLSQICREETDCQGESSLDNRLTADFKIRAYDLLRCAVSYRGATATLNAQSMLNQLCSASILRTSHISTKYTILQSGEEITRNVPSSHVHIREEENSWNIYVPENRRDRELCYSLSFPEALAKLFGISPAAREIISNILSKPIYILDDILEAEGIGMVPNIAPLPRPAADGSSAEASTDESSTATSDQEIISGEEAVASLWSSQAPRAPTSSVTRSLSHPGADLLQDRPEPAPEIADRRTYYSPDAYRDLLDNVIRIASQANLPHLNSRATAGNGQFLEGFDPVITFGIRSQGQVNHDTKIGAAGELFVFEILSTLGLPSFDLDNWESTIRGLVAVHPRYTDLRNWPGRETADITYDDEFGILTAILIANGYLVEQVWGDARPKYFIEVKTTTGGCGDRLFVSENQYRLMQRYTFPGGQSVPNVYIIFRVFNLGRNNLSVKLYVDPEAHRLRGDLVFESQAWTVRPRI